MQVTEYRVIHEENYGIPKLKVAHTYETSYDNRPSCEYLSYMLDEIYDLSYCNEEYMYVISMDTAFHIKGVYEAGHGDCGSVPVYIRELFTFLLLSGAERFVCVHNHPNGNLVASDGDKKWTQAMKLVANILHIEFTDHIIVTEEGFISIGDEDKALFSDINIDWDSIKI